MVCNGTQVNTIRLNRDLYFLPIFQGSYLHPIYVQLSSGDDEVCKGGDVKFVGSFKRVNRGQYPQRHGEVGEFLLSSPGLNGYNWYCLLFLAPKELPINKLLVGVVNSFNRIGGEKKMSEKFDVGEVFSEQKQPLAYYISGQYLRTTFHFISTLDM